MRTKEEKKAANRIAVRKYQLRHPERIKRPSPEKAAEYTRRWRERHPERNRASYTNQNRKFGKERDRLYRIRKFKENPRFYADKVSAWRKKHPAQWNVLMARAKRKRYQNSVHHRLKDLIAASIFKATKKNGTIKTKRTIELLGVPIPRFRLWLESQFQNGMDWSNMGKFGWHIDHIRPCASFDLADPIQQAQCFHYTNLQPLWWRDNLLKGDKWVA